MKNIFYILLSFVIINFTACSEANKQKAEKNQHRISCLLEKGRLYETEANIKQALVCYWDALDLLDNEQDTILKAKTYNRLGDLLFRYGLYEKAVENHRESYNLIQHLSDNRLLLETTHKLCIDYTLLNQKDTATYFLELCTRIAKEHKFPFAGISQKALPIASAQSTQTDSIGNIYEREQLLNWEAKYKKQKALLAIEQARNKDLIRVVGFLSIITVLVILLFITYRHKKQEEKRREEQLRWFNRIITDNKAQIENFQTELLNSRQRIKELQQTLETKHISAHELSLLHEELDYYISQENEIRQKEKSLRQREKLLLSESSMKAVVLLNEMKRLPKYMPIRTKEEWNILIEFMDILYDNYSQHIQSIKGLTDRDREICYLIRLGFTTGQLAVFYGISPSSITKAKFRIQKKTETDGKIWLAS